MKSEINNQPIENRPFFNIPFKMRIGMFICLAVLFFVITNVIIGFLIHFKGDSTPVMRIAAVLQDLFVFITPAVVTALLITRLPARFLEIEYRPNGLNILIAAVTLIASIPAINALVAWNESITLPESMKGIEEWIRQSEDTARHSIEVLIGGHSIGALIISILIVGVLAGFSEEIFFRGAFQRLLTTGGLNIHIAIWLTAFIFSGMHLQFYGFFGRFVLGLYFGYLLYWSRNLWLPVIIHILNNVLYLTGNYITAGNLEGTLNYDINTLGTEGWLLPTISVILVAAGMAMLYRRRVRT